MSKEEFIKERIRFLTEYLKTLWLVLIAVGGGTTGLFLSLEGELKVFLFLGGSLLTLFTMVGIVGITVEIFRLFTKLKEEVEREGG